ncbi:Dyp-type peroxidase [Podospora australis]|uniref:Dyp-type peroxidase n=1 Tax=Podospora australis TaxID=1536484 RepID=A0AAN6WJ31_9PEZI|nr:Dyp-type peroxidase [Podospora australis]
MSTVLLPPLIPPTTPSTGAPRLEKLEDIQGDVWSKGFPKSYETYYLFQIKRPAEFAGCLNKMITNKPHLIPNLNMVKDKRDEINYERQLAKEHQDKPKRLPIANALIAFTYKGLEAIQSGRQSHDDLWLDDIKATDPAFCRGMRSDGPALNDPTTKLNPLFSDPNVIHGLLKVAGSSKETVEERLKEIQLDLQRGTVITDVPGGFEGRLDGATRGGKNRGKEHFGFQDGISQPLMNGLDDIPPPDPGAALATSTMETDPKFLITTKDTRSQDTNGVTRPDWMYQGSFLVFRKLVQNVKAYNDLVQNNFKKYGCQTADHMGAKLMGRWPSGAPIALPAYHTSDAPPTDRCKVKKMNSFLYEKVDDSSAPHGCPLAAHIRKTNPRRADEKDSNSGDPGLLFTKIIRGGIPYGPDYTPGEPAGTERGLLFACYQGNIEDGFRHMQMIWCNNDSFPKGGSGFDPIVGQAKRPEDLKTLITADGTEQVPINPPLVTFRGGEYFFVPSIPALKGALTVNSAPLH